MPNYITVIGNIFMQPICALAEKLIELPVDEGETKSHHPDERGYSISICLLSAIMTESFIMRARYLNSKESSSFERNIFKFIEVQYPKLTTLDELTEIFILRDIIAHNHLWEIESANDTNIWTDLLKKEINPLTDQRTDKKYKLFVNMEMGITKNLGLHIIPTQIDKTDAIKVLKAIIEILFAIDNAENFALGFSNNYVMFQKNYINFIEASNLIVKNYK